MSEKSGFDEFYDDDNAKSPGILVSRSLVDFQRSSRNPSPVQTVEIQTPDFVSDQSNGPTIISLLSRDNVELEMKRSM